MKTDKIENGETWVVRINGKKKDREQVLNDITKVLENSELNDFEFEENEN